ncbi:type II secretion system secretin GspD [bacterium]|nr:type II secretion system secretin GspD [candidate division CSSED10-310 bacterium]
MFRYNFGLCLLLVVVLSSCIHFKDLPPTEAEPEMTAASEPVEMELSQTPTPTATYQLSSEPITHETATPTFTPLPTATLPPEDPESVEYIQMNFEDASLREILVYMAELAGWDYLISPEVGSGSVTLRTTKPFRKSDVEKVLYTILDMNNLAVVDGPVTSEGKPAFKKIIPKPDAKHSPILTREGKDLSAIPQEDRLVTQIISTEFVSPDEILNTIRPLISPDATIITHPGANMMIITEISSNIRRLIDIINILDQETALFELEIYQIQFADVQDIVSVLDRVISAKVSIGGSVTTTRTSTIPPSRRGSTARTTRQPQSSTDTGPIMIPDTRSNSLIVFALRRDLEFIREIISILDVDIYVTRKAYIYYVENAIAADLAKLLEAVYQGNEDQGRSIQRPSSRTRTSAPSSSEAIGGASEIQGEVSIVADERTNALIIVTAPVNYPYLVETIKKLDIMPKQVLIEVLIADVTLDEGLDMGVSWNLRGEGSIDVGGDTYNFDNSISQNIEPSASGLVLDIFEATRFNAMIAAKADENKLEILSSPHILVANNMEAAIDVGSDIPIVTSQTDEGLDAQGRRRYNSTIEYRSTGILLRVVPHINSARFVNMEISQEVSSISETTLGEISSPVIEKRKASTTVMVPDNQTLVIGGLIQRSKNPSREGVPWLYKVPLLKYLFGRHKYTERASELLIFLTPHVVSSPEQARDLSEKLRNKINIDESFYRDFVSVESSTMKGDNL